MAKEEKQEESRSSSLVPLTAGLGLGATAGGLGSLLLARYLQNNSTAPSPTPSGMSTGKITDMATRFGLSGLVSYLAQDAGADIGHRISRAYKLRGNQRRTAKNLAQLLISRGAGATAFFAMPDISNMIDNSASSVKAGSAVSPSEVFEKLAYRGLMLTRPAWLRQPRPRQQKAPIRPSIPPAPSAPPAAPPVAPSSPAQAAPTRPAFRPPAQAGLGMPAFRPPAQAGLGMPAYPGRTGVSMPNVGSLVNRALDSTGSAGAGLSRPAFRPPAQAGLGMPPSQAAPMMPISQPGQSRGSQLWQEARQAPIEAPAPVPRQAPRPAPLVDLGDPPMRPDGTVRDRGPYPGGRSSIDYGLNTHGAEPYAHKGIVWDARRGARSQPIGQTRPVNQQVVNRGQAAPRRITQPTLQLMGRDDSMIQRDRRIQELSRLHEERAKDPTGYFKQWVAQRAASGRPVSGSGPGMADYGKPRRRPLPTSTPRPLDPFEEFDPSNVRRTRSGRMPREEFARYRAWRDAQQERLPANYADRGARPVNTRRNRTEAQFEDMLEKDSAAMSNPEMIDKIATALAETEVAVRHGLMKKADLSALAMNPALHATLAGAALGSGAAGTLSAMSPDERERKKALRRAATGAIAGGALGLGAQQFYGPVSELLSLTGKNNPYKFVGKDPVQAVKTLDKLQSGSNVLGRTMGAVSNAVYDMTTPPNVFGLGGGLAAAYGGYRGGEMAIDKLLKADTPETEKFWAQLSELVKGGKKSKSKPSLQVQAQQEVADLLARIEPSSLDKKLKNLVKNRDFLFDEDDVVRSRGFNAFYQQSLDRQMKAWEAAQMAKPKYFKLQDYQKAYWNEYRRLYEELVKNRLAGLNTAAHYSMPTLGEAARKALAESKPWAFLGKRFGEAGKRSRVAPGLAGAGAGLLGYLLGSGLGEGINAGRRWLTERQYTRKA